MSRPLIILAAIALITWALVAAETFAQIPHG